MVERDIDSLRQILSPDLTHTHTGGNTETYDQYLSLLRGPMQYIAIDRHDTTLRFYGPVALMEGIAETTGRIGDGDPITIRNKILQVWVEGDDGWRMVAFQGTKLA